MKFVFLAFVLSSCGLLRDNRSNDPQTCRERAGYRIASIYTDPVALGKAIDVICIGAATGEATTTTRQP